MITKCPKCAGSIHTREVYHSIESSCLNCGHEVFEVPQDVVEEVQRFYGKVKFTNTHPIHHLTK